MPSRASHLLVLLACACTASPSSSGERSLDALAPARPAIAADEREPPNEREPASEREPPDEREPAPVELARARCGSVTAIWSGVDPNDDDTTQFPIEYGFHSLAFHFDAGPHAGQTLEFAPRGVLFHADWRREIFSPDCRRVVLLHDRFGPFEIVALDLLADYLRGASPPERVVLWDTGCTSAAVHGDARWLDADTLEYTAGACGTIETLRVDLRR